MTLWVDASSGASGDMLLGALLGAGVPLETLQAAVSAVSPEPVTLRQESVRRGELAATRCHVEVADSVHHRTWRDIHTMLLAADLEVGTRERAVAAFERLAVAEATVHGSDPLDVAFHEVGALDAIADVVGVCAGFAWLARASTTGRDVVVSPVAVGSGSVRGAHGTLPVPPPAVAELLRSVPSYAGPHGAPEMELCTPTGAALLTTLATGWGPQPAMTVESIGVGAGGRDPEGHANVLRLFVGAGSSEDRTSTTGESVLLESNVDDLDPRVWPQVIATLLEAGASDAWLTPILMKKGRPAHTLSVLVPADRAATVRTTVFRHTSAIGLRETTLDKHALEREMTRVEVDGQQIDVKLARHDGVLVNAMPEYDDVVRAATALGRPVSDVLADAVAASRGFFR
ncbi:nickel pincer cofactor biosynthesis protein LarC [Nocardioides sp.]|uniref:nickel pincer cofactor biosynthesis protein LarC n=1 Tax=Nocardioides sp. TaxID=35761 RepID=UPI002ED61E36